MKCRGRPPPRRRGARAAYLDLLLPALPGGYQVWSVESPSGGRWPFGGGVWERVRRREFLRRVSALRWRRVGERGGERVHVNPVLKALALRRRRVGESERLVGGYRWSAGRRESRRKSVSSQAEVGERGGESPYESRPKSG